MRTRLLLFLQPFVITFLAIYPCEGNQAKAQPACVTETARVETQRKDSAPELKLSADPHAWALAITSGGGLIGGGAGNLRVDSEGALQRWGTIRNEGAANAQRVALQPLNDAVTAAHPETWHACYVQPGNPNGCCDQFRYTLTLRRRAADHKDEDYQVFWYSDSIGRLPTDARAVVDAARKLTDDVLGPKNKKQAGTTGAK